MEYQEKGEFTDRNLPKYSTSRFYSMDQMKKAVDFYLEHGKNLNLTVEVLGYPSRPGTLSAWIDELAPGEKRVCKTGHTPIEYSQEVKEAAVLDFCTRDSSAEAVARRHGVDRCSLYFWKNQMLGEDYEVSKNQYTQEDVAAIQEGHFIRTERCGICYNSNQNL